MTSEGPYRGGHRTRWPWIVAGVIVVVAIGWRGLSPATTGRWVGRVVGVSDGDTIEVMHAGRAQKIRLYGIDCPEKRQDFGQRAKQFTSDLVYAQSVTVVPHDTDRYGRTVAEVFTADRRSLNEALVAAGLAWWYQRYAPQDTRFQRLEAAARSRGDGLWADRHPQPPWEYRQEQRSGSRRRR